MKIQSIAIAVTAVNLALMVILFARLNPATAQNEQNKTGIVRGTGLEIIDHSGKLRASITFHESETMNGTTYPAGILLRLIDSKGQPVVKIDASEEGGGLSFSNEKDGYIQLLAKESGGFLKIRNSDGKEEVIKP